MATFDYTLFGLHLRSEIELPELLPASQDSEPDVIIRNGQVSKAQVEGYGLHIIENGLLLVINNVGKYAISNGSEIVVCPNPDTSKQVVRLFLLGSAMGALLHQRRLLPLHANAIEIDGKAVVFMGQSGAGKSTLAAHFHDQGYRIIADDVCVVRFDPLDRAIVSAGLPRLRLWKEALHATGREPSAFDRTYGAEGGKEKYDVPIDRARVAAAAELGAIYLLGEGPKLSIARLPASEALKAVIENTYRGSFARLAGNARRHWESCVKLIQATPIYLVTRTRHLDNFHQEAQQMLAHAEQLKREGSMVTPLDTQ